MLSCIESLNLIIRHQSEFSLAICTSAIKLNSGVQSDSGEMAVLWSTSVMKQGPSLQAIQAAQGKLVYRHVMFLLRLILLPIPIPYTLLVLPFFCLPSHSLTKVNRDELVAESQRKCCPKSRKIPYGTSFATRQTDMRQFGFGFDTAAVWFCMTPQRLRLQKRHGLVSSEVPRNRNTSRANC